MHALPSIYLSPILWTAHTLTHTGKIRATHSIVPTKETALISCLPTCNLDLDCMPLLRCIRMFLTRWALEDCRLQPDSCSLFSLLRVSGPYVITNELSIYNAAEEKARKAFGAVKFKKNDTLWSNIHSSLITAMRTFSLCFCITACVLWKRQNMCPYRLLTGRESALLSPC